jgi:hypothetical protein
MRKFKFLEKPQESQSEYNGATSEFLIDLYNNQILISSWTNDILLQFDEDKNKDCLEFEFKDINGTEYFCSIYDDRSFELSQIIRYDEHSFEYINAFELNAEITSDYRHVLDYVNSLPNTISEYFSNINLNNGNI